MYQIDFNKPCRIHFIGIGGISMSGFAKFLHSINFKVSGSDSHQTKTTNNLSDIGIQVHYGQKASNITDDIELIVYTAAISEDNPEYQEGKRRNIPFLNRSELIGQIMNNYNNSIAVAGTHGKTTTTSMLTQIFMEGKMDPTVFVGGMLDSIGGNMRIGDSEHFITEACEYTNSFLDFNPDKAIILNIDEDHMDFFKDLDDIHNSFRLFAKLLPEKGQLYINGEIDNYNEISDNLSCQVISYGIIDPSHRVKDEIYDISADNISFDDLQSTSFDLYIKGKYMDRIALRDIGIHNISNCLPTIGIGLESKIPLDTIKEALANFSNSKRRLEFKGQVGGISIVDDYAHHPTEITATLSSAQIYNFNTVWCVFQPHTYSRTKRHLKDFASSLALADKIVLADIFPAREKDPGDISSKDLFRELEALGKEVYFFPSFNQIENFLLENCINGDLLITMGAGDIVKVGEALLGQ